MKAELILVGKTTDKLFATGIADYADRITHYLSFSINTIPAQRERELSGRKYRYIPKASIRNTSLFRSTIKDGDIIAITTSKKGLDTSHIGIAVWHKDGLHMLNASQIHKKVVEEPMTLYQYMQRHPSQTGIRIIRMK